MKAETVSLIRAGFKFVGPWLAARAILVDDSGVEAVLGFLTFALSVYHGWKSAKTERLKAAAQ